MVAGKPLSALKMPVKSSRWYGSSLASAALAVVDVVGEDHLAHGVDAVAFEEHVLGAGEADAVGAERERVLGLLGVVGVACGRRGGWPASTTS